MIRLPGGLLMDGVLRREARLRELTGEVELALVDPDASRRNLPGRVSLLLDAALAELDGEPTPPGTAARLSVADRQVLVRELAAAMGQGRLWLGALCGACDSLFEFEVEPRALPVKPAGEGYPRLTFDAATGSIRLRLPDGADQEALAGHEPGPDAMRALLCRCCIEPEGAAAVALIDGLDADELAVLDALFDAACPAIVTEVEAGCFACGATNRVLVDPYLALGTVAQGLLDEVHLLATTYYWHEAEILALPRSRRRHYVALIERERLVEA